MKIFVDGYWANNLGDDLFLKILCERYNQVDFEIDIKKSNSDVFVGIDNLKMNMTDDTRGKIKYLASKAILSIKKLLTRTGFYVHFKSYVLFTSKPDAYVEIGGSIFMLNGNENVLGNPLYKKRLMISNRIEKYFIIGSNFGPYESKKQIDDYRNFLKKITDICFRDEQSFGLFSDLKNSRYQADVILSLENNVSVTKGDHILISLINILEKKDPGLEDQNKYYSIYKKFLIDTITKYVRNGEKIILFSFCDLQGDRRFAEEIYSSLDVNVRKNVSIFSHTNIGDSLEIVKSSKKIIATRFHAMILGWVHQKPTFVISYSNKTVDSINSLNPSQYYINFSDLEDLKFDDLNKLYSTISMDKLRELQQSSSHQFDELERFINMDN